MLILQPGLLRKENQLHLSVTLFFFHDVKESLGKAKPSLKKYNN